MQFDTAEQMASVSTGSARPSSAEVSALAAILALFVLVNLLTAGLSPVVWTDEVFFTDPAYHLAAGDGFTSDAWPQPTGQFFANNVPLFPVVLAGWIKVAGFGLLSVRALNYVLSVVLAGMLWWGAARHALVRSAALRLGMVVVLLCGYEWSISFRTPRYDVLCAVWSAAGFLALMHPRAGVRWTVGFLVGALMALTGLQMIAYAGVMGLLAVLFFDRRRSIVFFSWVAAGGAVALGGLMALYYSQGVGEFFVNMVLHVGTTGSLEKEVRFIDLKLDIIRNLRRDHPTLLIVGFMLAVLSAATYWRGTWRWRSPVGFGLAAAISVPLVVGLMYNFPRYYGWMVDIPTTIALFAFLDHQRSAGRLLRSGVYAGLVLATVAGLPARIAMGLGEREARAYAPLAAFVEKNISPADHVVIDDPPFYAAHPATKHVTCQAHVPSLTQEERQSVTVVIAAVSRAEGYCRKMGGNWHVVDEYIPVRGQPAGRRFFRGVDLESYHLQVWRRVQ